MTFTADNLPEEALAVMHDYNSWYGSSESFAAKANHHAIRVLNRLDAAHGGRLSALLNGTAPAFTDEPPEVTFEACLTNWKNHWFQAACQPSVHVVAWGTFILPSLSLAVRQSPAPEAELKRWRVKSIFYDVEEHVTKPMTRADAEAIGEVIGEAGE